MTTVETSESCRSPDGTCSKWPYLILVVIRHGRDIVIVLLVIYPPASCNTSNMCMYIELRRFPILHNAWSLAIKYWLRLCTGTSSILLNNAYRLAMKENHMRVQNIQYLLSSNGLGYIWICPENANAQFHKLFRLRLKDQFIQRWYNFINTSSRFVTLCELSDDFKLPVYINVIKNPSI